MMKDKILILVLLLFTVIILSIHGSPISNNERYSRDIKSTKAYDAWMTDEQILDIGNMKSEGKSAVEIKEKIMSYFIKLTDEEKKIWNRYYKKLCVSWIKDVCSDEEQKELKVFWENKNMEKLEEKMKEYVNRLSDSKKEMVLAWKEECQNLWNDNSIEYNNVERRDTHHIPVNKLEESHNSNKNHHHTHEHEHEHKGKHNHHHHKRRHIQGDWSSFASEHLLWLTKDQKDEIEEMRQNGANKESIANKIIFFFNKISDNKREEAAESLKIACKELYTNVFGEQMVNKLKKLKESGANFDELESKFKEYMDEIDDENKLDELKSYNIACKQLFQEYRKKRHIHEHSNFNSFAKEHLSWLNEEQLDNIISMRNNNLEKSEIIKTIMDYFDEIENESKKLFALESLKSACRELLNDIFGSEKAREVKALKEKGLSHDEITEIVNGWKKDITDPKQIEKLNTYSPICTMLFKKKLSKRHIHGQFESFISQHLGFLNENQKNELRQMKIDGVSRHDIAKKIFTFYQETFGGVKKKAYEQLRSLCAEIIEDVFGKATLLNLREMRDSGMTYPELELTIQQKINELTDDYKIEKVKAYGPICRGIYKTNPPKRFKRNSSAKNCPDMKQIIENSNSWLNEKDRITINELQTKDFHSSRMGIKYISAFSKAVGEQKIKATKLLRAQCDQLLKREVGEKSFNELNDMIETNKSSDDIAVKFLDLVYLSKDENSCTWGNLVMLCRQTYISVSNYMREGISTRQKRHPHNDFDEFAKHHLTWLTSDQLNEVKKMINDGVENKDVGEKIMDFYDLLEDDNKVKATKELNLACSEIFEEIFGTEAKNIISEMKTSGKSIEEIGSKVAEYESKLGNEEKVLKFAAIKPSCKRLAMVERMRAQRKRHTDDDINSFIKDHLAWLTPEQLETIKSLDSSESNRQEFSNKVMEFYNEATGDVKTDATNQLAGACREFFRKTVGNEAADEMKKLKESGGTFEEMEQKANQFIASISNESDKEKMNIYGPKCKLIFKALARKKRHTDDDINSFIKDHLAWLTPEQLETIKSLASSESNRQEFSNKVMEFYNEATGDVKTDATNQLAGACREFFRKTVGNEAADEMKKLKESGGTFEEMEQKANQFIASISNESDKEKMNIYGPKCKLIFKALARKKRHLDGDYKSFVEEHLDWLTDGQLKELSDLREEGKCIKHQAQKVEEFYDVAEGEIKLLAKKHLEIACREAYTQLFTEDIIKEIKKMNEENATIEEIETKYEEYISKINDKDKKFKAEAYSSICKKVFRHTAEERSKRHIEGDFDSFATEHLNWMSTEQLNKIRSLKESGKSEGDIGKEIYNIYKSLSDENKNKATIALSLACKELFSNLLGPEATAELKKLHDAGASLESISSKTMEFENTITDEIVKKKLEAYRPGCKELYIEHKKIIS